MKNIFFAVVVLFTCLASAQKVTQEQLVGKWKLKKVAFSHAVVDVDTKTVVFTDSLIAAFAGREDALENSRNILIAGISKLPKYKFEFKEGYIFKSTVNGIAEKATYAIDTKDGKEYIAVNEYEYEVQASLVNGLLQWKRPQDDYTLYLEKVK